MQEDALRSHKTGMEHPLGVPIFLEVLVGRTAVLSKCGPPDYQHCHHLATWWKCSFSGPTPASRNRLSGAGIQRAVVTRCKVVLKHNKVCKQCYIKTNKGVSQSNMGNWHQFLRFPFEAGLHWTDVQGQAWSPLPSESWMELCEKSPHHLCMQGTQVCISITHQLPPSIPVLNISSLGASKLRRGTVIYTKN